MVQVYFIGAGPGDVELLTIKARSIIQQADVVIYADSLVNPDVCSFAGKDARIYKSAGLTLQDITGIIADAVKRGRTVARLQSGDPSIYGAIAEQMALLDEMGIEYEVVPGVSSLFAAAALLKIELTVPELSQTVIITRMEGGTPVPAAENLRSLASHGTTIALFLSASLAKDAVAALIEGGYKSSTAAAIVYKAGWPDNKVIRTTLKDLEEQLSSNRIDKQALILIGKALDKRRNSSRSKLYDADFKHEYRK